MDRPEASSLTPPSDNPRRNLSAIIDSGLAGVDPQPLFDRALAHSSDLFEPYSSFRVIAAGKAAPRMASAFANWAGQRLRGGLITTPWTTGLPAGFEHVRGSHPIPDGQSVVAGRRALEMARHRDEDALLVVLLSGGASAMLACPVDGLTIQQKAVTTSRLLEAGLDIGELNAVRKHLSSIKGGQLAAAAGASVTLALSDVVSPVEDDPSVIGSGPTVADPTTYGDALGAITRADVRVPGEVEHHLRRGAEGLVPETPKPGDPRLRDARFMVIGSRRDAMQAAATRASDLGYQVSVIAEPIAGAAVEAARAIADRLRDAVNRAHGPTCIISSGETTVRVHGTGRGGRNQELALALVPVLASLGTRVAVASLGTDGTDGPTDAAGACVDETTARRAAASGLKPDEFLARNDSYSFFDQLGDLIRTGPTGTNVGDLQIALLP